MMIRRRKNHRSRFVDVVVTEQQEILMNKLKVIWLVFLGGKFGNIDRTLFYPLSVLSPVFAKGLIFCNYNLSLYCGCL